MKIRNGFVSNSSSSSFLIYGVCFYVHDFTEKVEENLKNYPDILAKFKDTKEKEEELNDNVWEKCESLLELFKSDFEFYIPYDDYVYIGKPWDTIGDDETGSQFKEKTEQGLKKIFGNEIKVTTLEEAWTDG